MADPTASELIIRLLVDSGYGNLPPNSSWPIYRANEPDSPDNAMTAYDVAGHMDGRSMIDGILYEHIGFQIRLRSANYRTGREKAEAVRTFLASVYREDLLVNGILCKLHAAVRLLPIIYLGQEETRKRCIFVINGELTWQSASSDPGAPE